MNPESADSWIFFMLESAIRIRQEIRRIANPNLYENIFLFLNILH